MSFAKFHPLVNLIFFTSILIFSMFNMHPVFLCISFLASFTYSILLKGVKTLKQNICLILSLYSFGILVNPLFNHEGITILFYLKNGSPVTLESVIYGISSATMLLSVVFWFICFNEIITDDKLIYLFGRFLPSLSLVLSMTFRYIPKFKNQYIITLNAQKALGNDINNGNLIHKIKTVVKVLSAMIGWSLENAIDTSDSMKSRGYGLHKRTAFHHYKIKTKDIITILLVLFLLTVTVFLYQNSFNYFPYISEISISAYSILTYISFLILCFIPVVLEIREVLRWR